MTPYPAEGAADSDIAPKSTLRYNQATLWCPIPPVLWWEVQALYQRCALLPALLAQLCLQTSWGREGVRVKQPRRQGSNTAQFGGAGRSPALQ